MGKYPVRWRDIKRKAALAVGTYVAKKAVDYGVKHAHKFPWRKFLSSGRYIKPRKWVGGKGFMPYRYTHKRRRFRRGRDRTGGYYGRYNRNPTRTGEMKFIDFSIDDSTVVAGGTIAQVSCNAISQGTSESQRIGRRLTIRAIQWRFSIEMEAKQTATEAADVVRVIVYLDKQANGAIAAVTDLLDSSDYQSFRNLANSSRFRFLMDKSFRVNANGAAGNGSANDSLPKIIQGTWYKKCNIPIEFDSTAGVITEIRSNNIGVLLLSKAGECQFLSFMRVRFTG